MSRPATKCDLLKCNSVYEAQLYTAAASAEDVMRTSCKHRRESIKTTVLQLRVRRSYCSNGRLYCRANSHWPVPPDDDWSADVVTCRAHVMWRHDTLGTPVGDDVLPDLRVLREVRETVRQGRIGGQRSSSADCHSRYAQRQRYVLLANTIGTFPSLIRPPPFPWGTELNCLGTHWSNLHGRSQDNGRSLS